jgi:peptide/nickel transport system substrate-binding protein
MSAWDPIGIDGFSDNYISYIVEPATMREYFEAPNSAADTPYLVKWDLKDVQTNLGPDTTGDGKPEGLIDVPADALMYDSKAQAWVKVGPGVKAYSTAKYTFVDSTWHDGTKVELADFVYALGFTTDWAHKDGDADLNYEEAYASNFAPTLDTLKGIQYNKDGSINAWFDFNWPMDKNHVAYGGVNYVTPKAGNPGRPTKVSWPVNEALALLVTEEPQAERCTHHPGSFHDRSSTSPAPLRHGHQGQAERDGGEEVRPRIREGLHHRGQGRGSL